MLAWLHKTPKDSEATNGERFSNIELPEVPDECLHLLDILEEIGTVNTTGMSVSRLSWAEIDRWAIRTNFDLMPKEARALSMMSAVYASQINSKNEHCPIDDDSIRESIDMVNIKAMIDFAMSDSDD